MDLNVSFNDIDRDFVAEKWPSIPVSKLVHDTKCFSDNHGKKGVPLYLNIAENLHKMQLRREVPQAKLDIIDAFEKLRNGD